MNLNFLNFSPERWFRFLKRTAADADLLLMLRFNDLNLFYPSIQTDENRTHLWLTVNAVHVLLNHA